MSLNVIYLITLIYIHGWIIHNANLSPVWLHFNVLGSEVKYVLRVMPGLDVWSCFSWDSRSFHFLICEMGTILPALLLSQTIIFVDHKNFCPWTCFNVLHCTTGKHFTIVSHSFLYTLLRYWILKKVTAWK